MTQNVGGRELGGDPVSRRATVVLFALCMITAGAIAGAAVYRYFFWAGTLPGGFEASLVDYNADGAPEYLLTKARIDLPEAGDYSVNAVLLEEGTQSIVAQTTGRLNFDRGETIFSAGFWGPDIEAGARDGPYDVRITLIREQSDSIFERPASPDMVGRVYQWEFTTPAFASASFEAQRDPVTVVGDASAERRDYDADGEADLYRVHVPVTVSRTGFYAITTESDELFLRGVTDRFFGPVDGSGAQFVPIDQGARQLNIDLPSQQLYFSGIDGDLNLHITISDVEQVTTSHPCCGTGDPTFQEGPAFAPPPDGSELGLRAPYLLPPTPISFETEVHFVDDVHWYEFESPGMPIDFTGTVRDYGTDADGDGLYDFLTLEAEVVANTPGMYDFSGTLYAEGASSSAEMLLRSVPGTAGVVTTAWTRVNLNDWNRVGQPQTVRLDFSGAEILAAGVDGVFDAKLRVVPANVYIDPVIVHATAEYALAEFEPTAPKPAHLGEVTITPGASGEFTISVDTSGVPGSYTVITRVIHANGIVSLDTSFWLGNGAVPSMYFLTEVANAKDFAVAVYLMDSMGTGVDYIETPLAA